MSNLHRSPALATDASSCYRLILFVAGQERNSRIARENLARLCNEELPGRCTIQMVDVLEDFALALKHGVLVTPALLVVEPGPGGLIIGNLSNLQKVRMVLGLSSS